MLQKYVVMYRSGLKNRVLMKTCVENASNFAPFSQLAACSLNNKHSNAVFVDCVNCTVVKRNEIMELFHEHLFHNMVSFTLRETRLVFNQSLIIS